MIEGKILNGFLERLTKDALREIEKGGSLNQHNAMPFLIKEQFSKISRIEESVATSAELLDFKQYTIERFDTLESSLVGRTDGVESRLEGKIDGVESRLEAKIDGVESRLEAKIDNVEIKLEAKFENLETKVTCLETKFDEKFKVLYWVLGIGFSIITISISLLGFVIR